MRKIFFFMAISISILFASINVQTASKKDLMCIKGIGEKKVEALLKYRKTHKLKSADDLINIKGFGKTLIENVKKEIKSASCTTQKRNNKTSINKKSSNINNRVSKKKQKSLEKENKEDKKSSSKKDISN